MVVDMKHQIICSVKIRHHPRHDSVDFVSLLEKTNQIIPVSIVLAYKGYDSEQSPVATEKLGITSIFHQDMQTFQCTGHDGTIERCSKDMGMTEQHTIREIRHRQ